MEGVDDDALTLVLRFAGPAGSAALGTTSSRMDERVSGNARLWREFCRLRWGNAVAPPSAGDGGDVDWREYYRIRSSSWRIPPVTSPLSLIQEIYALDPYRMLASCILC